MPTRHLPYDWWMPGQELVATVRSASRPLLAFVRSAHGRVTVACYAKLSETEFSVLCEYSDEIYRHRAAAHAPVCAVFRLVDSHIYSFPEDFNF